MPRYEYMNIIGFPCIEVQNTLQN